MGLGQKINEFIYDILNDYQIEPQMLQNLNHICSLFVISHTLPKMEVSIQHAEIIALYDSKSMRILIN